MGSAKTVPLMLRYQGLFDFTGLYHFVVQWFKNNKYDYYEKNWKEKDATPEGREVTVKMNPEKKITEYIRYKYGITWLLIDVHDVEVLQHGKPRTLTHARFTFTMKGGVEYDWQRFSSRSKLLGKFFEKNVFDKEIKQHKNDLEREMQVLLDEIKKYLHMEVSSEVTS